MDLGIKNVAGVNAMPVYSRLVGLARIVDVSRVGAGVALSLRDAIRGLNLRYRGTITFVGVTRIDSVDLLNDLVQRELEPGWTVDGMSFEDGVVTLGATQEGMREDFGVRHSISCAAVELRMRPAVMRTLGNHLRRL